MDALSGLSQHHFYLLYRPFPGEKPRNPPNHPQQTRSREHTRHRRRRMKKTDAPASPSSSAYFSAGVEASPPSPPTIGRRRRRTRGRRLGLLPRRSSRGCETQRLRMLSSCLRKTGSAGEEERMVGEGFDPERRRRDSGDGEGAGDSCGPAMLRCYRRKPWSRL